MQTESQEKSIPLLNNIHFIELLQHKVANFNERKYAFAREFYFTDAESFSECMSLYSYCNELFNSIDFESIMEVLFNSLEDFLFPFDFYSEDLSDEEKEDKFKEVTCFNAHNKFYDIRTAITQLYKIYESTDRINRLSDRDESKSGSLS
ncbi:MAG TPA: hypothetical protein VFW07_01445 [Parafilimonas sp.]|nr:hypothetical protein [Parafilimonas sp.]